MSVTETFRPLVRYSVTDAEIAILRDQYGALTCDTPQGYEAVRGAIKVFRDLRGQVEKRRIELGAEALAWGRTVNAEARRLTEILLEIEDPLKARKQLVDAERDRIKHEAEEAERCELEAQIRATREAEEARLRLIREAEAAALAEERAQLAVERQQIVERQAHEARLLVQQQEAIAVVLRAEQQAIEADRRALQQERERADRVEFERLTRIKAEADAVEKIDRDRIAALERAALIAGLQPDVSKVRAFAGAIRAIAPPTLSSKKLSVTVAAAASVLVRIADDLETAVSASGKAGNE